MNARLIAFLLAGGLVASLYAQYAPTEEAQPEVPLNVVAHEASCAIPDLEELELNPAQEKRVREMCMDCDRITTSLAGVIATKETALNEALAAEKLDAEHVRVLARELGLARSEMLQECVEAILAVRSTLSPEQRECLQSGCATGCMK